MPKALEGPRWRQPCPEGVACPDYGPFRRFGPCAECVRRHARTPTSCGPAAFSAREWQRLFDGPLEWRSPAPLQIHCPLIPVTFGQVAKYGIAERFPEIDAWAVPVHKVMNLHGKFRSRDLKDYLGLPADRRLILSTVAPDDFVEMLWERRADLDFAAVGADYWFPAHFSIYDRDGRCFQIFNARRQQLHASAVRSRFVWFRLGQSIPVEFLEPIRSAPSVLISCQQMYSALNREILRREVRIADEWFPLGARFFFISHARGGLEPLRAGRTSYQFDERWIMLGLHGRDHRNRAVPRLSLEELLVRNLREALIEAKRGSAAPPCKRSSQ